jgi:sec-independent protein translocase protein TatC
MAADSGSDSSEGSFLSHLVELRNRLLYAVAAIGLVAIPYLFYSNEVYELFATPLLRALPPGTSMIATEVATPFFTPLKLALLAAVVTCVPLILYQLWAFVAPGLYKHEKRLVFPLLLSSTLLFYAGMAFAYFIVFPNVFAFLVGSAPKGVTVMTDIKAYLDFAITIFLAFGFSFEVPVAVVLLTRMGVVSPASLAAKRPYVFLGCFIVGAVLTPPDILSQTFLALPMYLLFEIGLFFARRVAPKEAIEEGHRGLSDAEIEREFDRHEKHTAGTKRKRTRKKSARKAV